MWSLNIAHSEADIVLWKKGKQHSNANINIIKNIYNFLLASNFQLCSNHTQFSRYYKHDKNCMPVAPLTTI